MKYNILNFAQGLLMADPLVIEHNVDVFDLHYLEWFSDFTQNQKMVRKIIKTGDRLETYYWIDFSYLAEQFPFFRISAKRIARRFEKMELAGLVKRHISAGKETCVVNEKERVRKVVGRRTYYKLTTDYYNLRGGSLSKTTAEREHAESLDALLNEFED